MATQPNRTYSEFFSSGLRAISGTTTSQSSSSRPSSGYSSPIISSTPPKVLESSGRYNVLRGLSRRTRASSSPTSPFTPSQDTTTRRQRRTSIVDLPSRLLGRMMNSTNTWSLPDKTHDHDRVRRSEDSSAATRNSSSYKKIRPIIDPFDASPYSSSFFIDYVETPVSIPTPPRPQSFLLGKEPTSTHLNFPLRRARPRPTSIQSMPQIPSQSRRSSFQFRPMSSDKYDRSWELEEEEAPSPAWGDDELDDPAASIDWRQFHNDLLREDS